LTDAEARRWLEAYVAGVNAYLDQRNGVLPPEFLLLGHEPEPFTPVDVIGWAKMMAWDLAGNWDRELTRARLMNNLNEDEVRDLYPAWPGEMFVTIEGSWADVDGGLTGTGDETGGDPVSPDPDSDDVNPDGDDIAPLPPLPDEDELPDPGDLQEGNFAAAPA